MTTNEYLGDAFNKAESPKEMEMYALTGIAIALARICDVIERMESQKNGDGVQNR